MAATLRAFAVVLRELWPVLLVLLALGVAAWAGARPHAARLAAWRAERKRLEAEVVRLSHVSGEVEALVEAQGRVAAHDVLRPDRPRWAFWVR
jgi:hypothetical protein